MQEASKGNQRRVVWWTAHPRVDVKYKHHPMERNTQTKHEFWDSCTEEDKVIVKQFAEVFQAKWEGEE